MKRIGLALGGGGVRGVAHIAYIKALEELGLRPSVISGTSSGAIAGAMYAGGMTPDEMLDSMKDVISLRGGKAGGNARPERKTGGMAETAARRRLMRLLPKTRFEELDIPLKVVATNFHTLKERVFDSGELLPAIMASVALPSAFPPQLVDGEYYVDGGATNIVPFDIIRNECDILIAIDVSLVRPAILKPTQKNAGHATWAATQEAYIDTKLKLCSVEVFERPSFDSISTLEFFKFKKVYDQAMTYVPGFIEKLKNADIKG